MEQIAELTKVLQAPLQQQLQQQQKIEKQQFLQQQLRLEKLFKQQAKNNKTLLEGVLSRTTKELGSRFFSAEGISNSL